MYYMAMYKYCMRCTMKYDEIAKKLRDFTDEKDPFYTIKLRDMVINLALDELDEGYFSILNNKNYKVSLRFAAYYSIFIFYRRYEHHTLLYALVEKYSDQFKKFNLNDVVLSQYYKFKFLDTNDEFAIINAIKYAQKATENLGENAGVLQNYAELVACALEANSEEGRVYLEDSIKCIDKAMLIMHNYPKHYCTKGRLLSWLGDYDNAKRYIRKAVDLETSDNKDSLIRISQYNNYYIDIKTRESIEKLSSHISDAEDFAKNINEQTKLNSEKVFERLDNMQTRYLELLAFFSAILALILSVIEIVADFSEFNAAVGLIMVMGGVLILGFGVLRILITYNNDEMNWKKYMCIFFSGILMICLGYLVGNINYGRM